MNFEYTKHRSPLAREVRSESIKKRTEINQEKLCESPGCERHRDGVARFCRTHRKRLRLIGHPTLKEPANKHLKPLEKIIRDEIKLLPKKLRVQVESDLAYAQRKLRKPPSYAERPHRVQANYTQKTKADIIFGWATKQEIALSDLIIRRAALSLWGAVAYEGEETDKRRFLNTQCGLWLVRMVNMGHTHLRTRNVLTEDKTWPIGDPRRDRWVTVTEKEVFRYSMGGNVKQQIGKRAEAMMYEVLGTHWITDSLIAKASEALKETHEL